MRRFDLRKMSVTLGHGLSNMVRRARRVGGDVEISSRPLGGTTVLAWVPWTKQDPRTVAEPEPPQEF